MSPAQRRNTTLFILLVTFVVSVISWPLHIYGFDATAVREEARAMILEHRLAILQPPETPLAGPGEYFIRKEGSGLFYSKYGVFGAVAAAPPLVAEYLLTGQLPPYDSRDRPYLLNLYNTLLTCLTALLLTRVAALFVSKPWVIASFVLSCLFGTFVWNYTRAQSSEIVQVLLAAIAFDALVRWMRAESGLTNDDAVDRERRRLQGKRLAVVWTCVGAMVLTRLYFAVLLPVIVVALSVTVPAGDRKRARWSAVIPPLLILAVLAIINDIKFGSPFLTGYHAWAPERHRLTLNPIPGLLGFLTSAQKAVWWHFPLTLPALFGWPAFYRHHKREARLLLLAATVYFLPLCTVSSWAGEWSYGPRYLLAGLPLVCLPAATWAASLGRRPLHRLVLGTGAALLLVSGYLNWQVNRVEYFTANAIKVPFQQAAEVHSTVDLWIDDQPFPGREYFDRRPWFLINADILWHRGDLRTMALAPYARQAFSAEEFEAYRREIWSARQFTNLYWQTNGKRFDELKFKFPPEWVTPSPTTSPAPTGN